MISNPSAPDGLWTALELRKLPNNERDSILAEAAEKAEKEYRSNHDLTDACDVEALKSGPGRCWNSDVLAKLKQQVFDRAAGNGS